MNNDTEKDLLATRLKREIEQMEQENEAVHKELTTAIGIIHDMLQCHRLNDHIGHRARHFLNTRKRY